MVLTDFAEKLPDSLKIQIFATDVDEITTSEAREHRYPHSIDVDVSPARLKRHFVRENKYYRIKKELREAVLFAPHDVLRDPPFSKLDLIARRNLLIYLNRDTQQRLMEIFHFALATKGYLFLGSSETAEAAPQLFSTLDKNLRIYTRRPLELSPPNAAPKMPITGRWELKPPVVKSGGRMPRPFSLGEVHYKLLERYAPPSVLVDKDSTYSTFPNQRAGTCVCAAAAVEQPFEAHQSGSARRSARRALHRAARA
jgi:two-component system CheB/CheR fusion protein